MISRDNKRDIGWGVLLITFGIVALLNLFTSLADWMVILILAGGGLVNLALYLQFSCHAQNSVLYAVSGTITFSELFSGDPNETSGADKLTEAEFDVAVGDPRNAEPGSTDLPPDQISRLTGYMRFHFVRGQPSQPFP